MRRQVLSTTLSNSSLSKILLIRQFFFRQRFGFNRKLKLGSEVEFINANFCMESQLENFFK